MRTIASPLAGWLLAGLMCLAGPAQAQEDAPGRVGRVGDTQGTVWLLDRQDNEWVAAERNRPLTRGDRLATDAGGRAELQIGSTTLRLDGQTEVTLRELDDAQVQVAVDRGTLALRVRSSEVARELQVVSDAGRVLPQVAGHYRVDVDAPSMVLGVWSGSARFDAPDSALDVRAGQRAEFWREGGATHYTWSSPAQDPFSDWVLAQDRADDQRLAALDREVSPEMTGVDDLARYGRWDNHPEYGAIWAPTSVAAGWAPYRYGRWSWISPWGWTWVDDAPWGFAPFHYGRWVQWNGRWGWAPGRYAVRPVYSPGLVAWIGGGNVSVGVTVGGPPYVGWVPLSPRERYVPGYRIAPRWRDHLDPYYGPGPRPPGWRLPDRGHGTPWVNERLPGGITVVPSDILRRRERIGDRVITDPRGNRDFWDHRRDGWRPPPPTAGLLPRPDDRNPRPWPDRRRDDAPPSRVIDSGNPPGSIGRPWPGRTVDTGRDFDRDRDNNGRDDRIDRELLERQRGNDRNADGVPDHWRGVNPGGGLRNRDGSPAAPVVRPPSERVVPVQPQWQRPPQGGGQPQPQPRGMPEQRAVPVPRPMPAQPAPAPRMEAPRMEAPRMPMGGPGRDKSGAERAERADRGPRQNER
ncbi:MULTISPECIES: DUF6600 domain-containing protein [Aquincola]|uniref:DUF6600 domain-containing protein n=1 Tax=Aquincola TaxID=391952 RepID=UPI00069894C9|nr:MULTISPECIES: DUF6600 domain-containing protein [Aquincola]MCR5865123.1 FecR domain-containing protein [Aquincola sp. J276]